MTKAFYVGIFCCTSLTFAQQTGGVPSQQDVRDTLECSQRGTLHQELAKFVYRDGQFRYSTAFSKGSEGRQVTAVMLFEDSRSLIIEAVLTTESIGIVNVASFERSGSHWKLEETHAGIQTAQDVNRLASRLGQQKLKIVQSSSPRGNSKTCVGIGIQ